MEIVDFFNNCYSTRDLCTALWVFTVFVYEMKEGTRQFTEKGSVMKFYKKEDGERVSCFVGFFLAFGLLHLHMSFIYLKNATSLIKEMLHH